MQLKKLTTIEEFENLKQGDIVVVEYDEKQPYWNKKMQGIKSYNIHSVKTRQKELILQIKNNHYFNYEMYLNGTSVVKNAYIILKNDAGDNSEVKYCKKCSYRSEMCVCKDAFGRKDE